MAKSHFRAGVVLVVRRDDGQVLAFERGDVPGAWQLPQGGIEQAESPVDAAWRELREETGLGPTEVELVREGDRWTVYEYPEVIGGAGRLGQAHRWFFFRARHADLVPVPDGDEFIAWRWMAPADLIAEVVTFRRDGYRQMLDGDG